MILTCPACATSYSVPDDALGPKGRRVRCQSCGNVWTAGADAPLELSSPAAKTTEAAAHPPVAEEPTSAVPAPELPRAFRARAEQQRRVRRAATHGAVWAGLASAFLGILGAAWLFRTDVVEIFPRAAAAYAAVGAPVNPIGLEFEALTARQSLRDPGKVVVSGALRNLRDREVAPPPVRIALLDAHGAEVAHTLVTIEAAPVLPGGVQGFAAVMPDPGGKAADVGVEFVARGSVRPAQTAHAAPAHEPAQAPEHGALTAETEPETEAAAPAHGGLRPALDPEHGPPIDVATPIASGLDSHAGEAVTTSHHD